MMMFIVAVTFYLYLIISILAFIYLLIKNPRIFDPTEPYPCPRFFYPMVIGVFITLCYVLFFGFRDFFRFIPYSWGSYGEDGDWNATRDSISAALIFLTTFYFLYLVGEVQKKEGAILKLKRRNKKKALMLNGSWDSFSSEKKKLLADESSTLPPELQDKVNALLGG